MKEWNHFKFEDFTCKCGCGENKIVEDFVDKLDKLRDDCGFPFIVNSGYRCPKHNSEESTTGFTGPHTTGRAVDISAARGYAYQLMKHAMMAGFTGIGISQKGDKRFVHLDDLDNAPGRPRPTVWSY